MSVETWETSGAIGGIDQTKKAITSYPSVDELEEWYAEKGELTLGLVDENIRGEAGSADVHMLPLSYPIELKQIRQKYDPSELQELADRMPVEIIDGKPKVDLENSPTINVMDREHAIVFFEKFNKYHRGEIEPIDIDLLEPAQDGLYYVIINGHRRIRALKLKCLEIGMRAENLNVSFTLEHNLPFEKSKSKQYTENTYVAPTPVEDAHAIELHYLFLRDEGKDCSNAALQKVFGYGRDKIADALRFVTAPEEITKFIGKGITYTNVVDLVKLREAYAEYLKRQYEYEYQRERELDLRATDEVKEQRLQDYFVAIAGISDLSAGRMQDYFESSILNRLQGKSTADVGGKIRAKIKAVKGEYGYTNDTLLIFDEESERRMTRVKTRRGMGNVAIETLGYLLAQDDLSPEQLVQLQELIDSKRTVPEPALVQEAEADIIPLFDEESA